MKGKREPLEVRFWRFVHKTDACWLWTGGKMTGGYGFLKINRQMKSAHRVSFVLAGGTIPDGMWVLHKCDVRNCVNPDHLFLGTRADNMRDAWAKGRTALQAWAQSRR